ncbi:MAG: nickel pincer cofactor biosynthesis protein LarC [Candidatus Omnitrophica bacterium]|nr:nickel pincer cofactor biosynthesis protein LarC [Candidatus Omnitrophota bacterium]
MKIAYFDCFSGISGDMILGAFIDYGLSVSDLQKELLRLKIGKIQIKVKKVKRHHLSATKVEIAAKKEMRFSNLSGLNAVIEKSSLDKESKLSAKKIFLALAKAEAKVHKEHINHVHFHQLGELDTVIDIVGTILAKKILGIEKMYSSYLTLGSGVVNFGKDSFPLPAPATMELLKQRVVNFNPGIRYETITPTGASILSELTEPISEFMPMRIIGIGYGAGSYNEGLVPNALRLVVGDAITGVSNDTIIVLETNIDDMIAVQFEMLFERLFNAGALDVYTSAVLMKKQRPATLLHVQAQEKDLEAVLKVIFSETTTLGVRLQKVFRRKLERKLLNLKSDYGIIVKVKIAFLDKIAVNVAPEYEDCKKIAKIKNLSFKSVYESIKAQALRKFIAADNKYDLASLIADCS